MKRWLIAPWLPFMAIGASGCQLFIEAPRTTIAVEGDAWAAPKRTRGGPRVNEHFDWYRELSCAGGTVRCGVWASDPENTVEVDIFSDVDDESTVRLTIVAGDARTRVSGSMRRADGANYWCPDRLFRPYVSGDEVTIPRRGSLVAVFRSQDLWGHYPPESGDRVHLGCKMRAGSETYELQGDLTITSVTRDKSIIMGH